MAHIFSTYRLIVFLVVCVWCGLSVGYIPLICPSGTFLLDGSSCQECRAGNFCIDGVESPCVNIDTHDSSLAVWTYSLEGATECSILMDGYIYTSSSTLPTTVGDEITYASFISQLVESGVLPSISYEKRISIELSPRA
jgi:hypothetical protein